MATVREIYISTACKVCIYVAYILRRHTHTHTHTHTHARTHTHTKTNTLQGSWRRGHSHRRDFNHTMPCGNYINSLAHQSSMWNGHIQTSKKTKFSLSSLSLSLSLSPPFPFLLGVTTTYLLSLPSATGHALPISNCSIRGRPWYRQPQWSQTNHNHDHEIGLLT